VMKIPSALKSLQEMVVVMIVLASTLMAFPDNPLVHVIFDWVHDQESLNDNGF
jgi:hypothetical protein